MTSFCIKPQPSAIKFFHLILLFFIMRTSTQATTPQYIPTQLGPIAVYIKEVPNTQPIVFLHGIYYDHHLWNYYTSRIHHQTTITIDMPLHGKSQATPMTWDLEDCASMLLEILDSLEIPVVVGIGHSWGSMTLLRAAHQQPGRFAKLGLCNHPFEAPSPKTIRQFKAQHWVLPFRKFYTKQVAKATYGQAIYQQNPTLLEFLEHSMSQLSNKAVKYTDQAVIIKATNSQQLLEDLPLPVFSLKGQQDYVPTPPATIPLQVVEGGHVSPLEVPEQVWKWLQKNLLS